MRIKLVYGEHSIVLDVEDCHGVYADDTLEGDRILGYYVANKSYMENND